MKYKDFYEFAYKLLYNVTPLPADCGRLCDAACCKGDEETGMYLFPGERVMYKNSPEWIKIEQSAFEYDDNVFADIALCTPFCERSLRPLACRIFPLFPYVKNGNMEVIMDPRGKAMCPLARVISKSGLDCGFVRRVTYLSKIMMKNKAMRNYLDELSRLIDEQIFI